MFLTIICIQQSAEAGSTGFIQNSRIIPDKNTYCLTKQKN